jgi:hypothetical protein
MMTIKHITPIHSINRYDEQGKASEGKKEMNDVGGTKRTKGVMNEILMTLKRMSDR